MDNDKDANMIDPAMALVVAANDRTLGSGEDSSVPDPLHSNCTITFHCTRDASGRQHCTSTSSCGSMHGITAARPE